MKHPQTFDHERVHFNLARLKKGGVTFEIAIDPDAAVRYKERGNGNIHEILHSEHIFHDVSQGKFASEHELVRVFGTREVVPIAERIIKEGEVQLTEEYRKQLRERKFNRLVALIARYAVDPKTKFPHPPQRILNAMEEANVKIDYLKTADEQVEHVVRQLQPILPIKMETKSIHIHIPAQFAPKSISVLKKYAQPKNESWNNDGSFSCIVEIPAGLEPDLYDELNKTTHGNIETKVVSG